MLVAAAVPSGRVWQANMGICFASMCALAASHGIGIGILGIECTWVAQARNVLVRQAIDAKADYILFVDDDMVFPPEALLVLLEHKRDISGVLYSRRGFPYDEVGILDDEDKNKTEGLAKARLLGTGLMLIKTTVFEHVPKPWFLWTDTHSDDAYFIKQARESGFVVWCDLDLSMQIGHIGNHVFTLKSRKDDKQNGMDSR